MRSGISIRMMKVSNPFSHLSLWDAALSPASHIYQGAWQCTHCDLPLLLNHLYRQAGWKRTLQVRHCRRGSWPLVALMTL